MYLEEKGWFCQTSDIHALGMNNIKMSISEGMCYEQDNFQDFARGGQKCIKGRRRQRSYVRQKGGNVLGSYVSMIWGGANHG